MTPYNWKSDKTRMLRMLRNSKTLKEKHGWARETGAGFIADDIMDVQILDKGHLYFRFPCHRQAMRIRDLNLRETEEAIKYLEKQEGKQ